MEDENDQGMRLMEEKNELPLEKDETKIQINGSNKIDNDDNIKKNDLNEDDAAFLETIIDQKGEDELLKLESVQQDKSVENDLEKLFNKVQNNTEADDGDSKQGDNGLLEECESPKEIELALQDEQSNEIPSNEDDDSNQDVENNDINEMEKQDLQIDDDMTLTSKETPEVFVNNDIESVVQTPINDSDQTEISNQESSFKLSADGGKSEMQLDEQSNAKKEEIIPNEIASESNDVEMADTNNDSEESKNKLEEKFDIKTEEHKCINNAENTILPGRVELKFMRKFSKECGKLSRADLEELLLEKLTEAIVFKSQCTEMRTKFEKQEETIDRLQKRLAVLTKQYNDLDMIHKRVEKDLKERPEGPIQPVRITRAVGLQVFLEKSNSTMVIATSSNNKNKPIYNNVSSSPTSVNKNNGSIAKRQMDTESMPAVRNNTNENEPKRKKCKIITPLRPVLSEKEETSLKMQEACIEKNIRMKVATKVANPVHVAQKISSPNLSVTPIQNGIQKQTSM